jgi:hypothetical protein
LDLGKAEVLRQAASRHRFLILPELIPARPELTKRRQSAIVRHVARNSPSAFPSNNRPLLIRLPEAPVALAAHVHETPRIFSNPDFGYQIRRSAMKPVEGPVPVFEHLPPDSAAA